LVAQYAQLVAESLEGISPEEAYLVGLLHETGAIPKVLSWPNDGLDDRESASSLAMEGSLPLFVLSAMQSMNDSCSSTWKIVLTSAHELAEARPDFNPTTRQDFVPSLLSPRWGKCVPIVADYLLARS
jgi:inorganic pyrophosphatase